MELMIGAGLALALLYFWLLANWFARVVMFLVLIPVLTFVALWALYPLLHTPADSQTNMAFAIAIGFLASWFVSYAPTYYRRRKDYEF